MTASFGVAQQSGSDEGASGLSARADSALYAAKSAGRNRTCRAPDALSLGQRPALDAV